MEECTVCRTTMELFDKQPVDDQHEVLFFRCPLCAKSAQRLMTSKTVLLERNDDY